jgi:ABC-type amino acid transport substrate-binding protein
MKRLATIAILATLALTGAASAAAPVATITPGQLTVGVSLPSEGFEVGVAKGEQVTYAQGFDIDFARAQITITDQRRRTADFTQPYMTVDQGVLAAQTVNPVPRTLADLRSLRVCALSKSTGAEAAKTVIAPTKPTRQIGNVPTLMLNLQTGRCQAVVYDAPTLGTPSRRGRPTATAPSSA